MASKYAATYQIPPAFPQILKDFAREVLRNQPPNIYEYGAHYFTQLLEQQQQEGEQLRQVLESLFQQADVDGNGFLDHKEFYALLKSAQLGLSEVQIRLLMSEADEDANGRISYAEFVPAALDLIASVHANLDRYGRMEDAREYVHGLHRDEFLALIHSKFVEADAAQQGQVPRAAARQVLDDGELGLTRHEVNLLMAEMDDNGDGLISYKEFVGHVYPLLVDLHASRMLGLPNNEEEVRAVLMQAFQMYDPKQEGVISPQQLQKALQGADIGLPSVHIHTLMGIVPFDAPEIHYAQFAAHISAPVMAIIAGDPLNGDPAEMVAGMDRPTMQENLASLFSSRDPEGSGLLPWHEFRDAVCALPLSEPQQNMLLSLGAANAAEPADPAAGEEEQEMEVIYLGVVRRGFDVLASSSRLGIAVDAPV